MQVEALTATGCEKIFEGTASGAQKNRPELAKAISYLRREACWFGSWIASRGR